MFPESLGTNELGDYTGVQRTAQPFIHINLRAKPALNEFAPLEVEDDALYYAVFELYGNEVVENNILARTIEPILPIRDPNRLVVRDVCMDCKNIYYTGQFHNITKTLATGLAVEIIIPNIIDIASVSLDSNKTLVNGKLATPVISFDGRMMRMVWKSNLGIRKHKTLHKPDTGKVEFAFCANFKNGTSRQQMFEADLEPERATSYFNYHDSVQLATKLDFRDFTEAFVGTGDEFDNRSGDIRFARKGIGNCTHCKSICQGTPVKKEKWYETKEGMLIISAIILALLALILKRIFFPKPKLPGPPQGF